MTFQEPQPSDLKTMAGWALTKRENASDAQVLALHKFRDGCEDLADNYPSHTIQKADILEFPVSNTITKRAMDTACHVSGSGVVPVEVLAIIHPGMVNNGECRHKFHIQTQRCIGCGKSYLEVKGVKPELMT